jgi:hypothetical protein
VAPCLSLFSPRFATRRPGVRIPSRPPDSKELNQLFDITIRCRPPDKPHLRHDPVQFHDPGTCGSIVLGPLFHVRTLSFQHFEADELDAPRARRPHGRVRHSVLWGPVGNSVRIASGTFACSWLCEGRRSDSATGERTPPGPSNRAKVAIKWMNRTTRLRIAES